MNEAIFGKKKKKVKWADAIVNIVQATFKKKIRERRTFNRKEDGFINDENDETSQVKFFLHFCTQMMSVNDLLVR